MKALPTWPHSRARGWAAGVRVRPKRNTADPPSEASRKGDRGTPTNKRAKPMPVAAPTVHHIRRPAPLTICRNLDVGLSCPDDNVDCFACENIHLFLACLTQVVNSRACYARIADLIRDFASKPPYPFISLTGIEVWCPVYSCDQCSSLFFSRSMVYF